MQVFISYRRNDTPFAAQALRYALKSADHTVFLDTGSIEDGEAFRDVIRDSLHTSDLVLSLIGRQFEASRLRQPLDAVAFEWRQARFLGCVVHIVLVDGAAMPQEPDLPDDLRWICKRSASILDGPTLGNQIDALVDEVPRIGARARGSYRVLWVDDKPANNEYERAELRTNGLVFDNVVSTTEAIEQLKTSTYDLVITDLGRRWSSDGSLEAGHRLLEEPVIASALTT